MDDFQDFSLTVPVQSQDIQLDQFLSKSLPLSKARIHQAIEEGGVYINKKRCQEAALQLQGGEKLRIVTLAHETLIPFSKKQIIWQQSPFFLVHKKSGQYAQEALHRSQGTLPDELARHLRLNPEQTKQFRPVHRLDRDTSGLMLLCSDPKQLQQIQNLWHSHVQKSYLAVVSPAPDWDHKRMTFPIGKRRNQQGNYAVDQQGRACDTEAKVLERSDGKALLQLIPHTGRTHQLRIHLSHIGCPILGDHRYAGKKHARLMLHAHTLCVQVPALSKNHTWRTDPEEDWQWQ